MDSRGSERAGTPPLLAATGLTRRFPGVVALDDVSLALAPGEVHGLVGQNGAGKSTLINILSGMLRPDAGSIAVAGAEVAIRDARHARALGIATVYQELSLLPNLTIAENLALGREPRRRGLLDAAAAAARATEALARLGLDLPADAPVGRLPLAERQLVECAKALASDPRILILDEPTAPLGPREAGLLFAAVRRLRAEGVAVLYVSHRFGEVLALCDRVTVLRNGRRVVTAPRAAWTEERLTEQMIGSGAARFLAAPRGGPGGAPALEVQDLGFGDRVRGVSFALRQGEILALAGLLGAGQTAVARMIGGDLAPDRGSVTRHGRTLPPGRPHAAVAAGICLLTEDRKREGILPNRPLRENLAVASLAARRRGPGIVDAAAERAAVARALGDFGVAAASPEVPMRTLSGGNQQKALIARWALAEAAVFVLIEPTRGVDVGARAEIYRRIDALARAGRAVLLVSGDMAEVLALADRILVLRGGRITEEVRPAGLDEERLSLLVQGAAA